MFVCASTRSAVAERAIEIELTPPVPFLVDELAEAIRLRLAPTGPGVHLRVTGTSAGVRVDVAAVSRDVHLGGLGGAAAARLVALAASDLLLDDLASEPELVLRAPTAPRPASEGARDPRRVSLGLVGMVAAWSDPLAGAAAEVVIGRRRYATTIELAGGSLVSGDVRALAALARLDLGVRFWLVELRGGISVAPIMVSTGAGDRTVLVGGNASVRLRAPMWGAARGVLAVGADVFATRTTYFVDGMVVMATPRAAPWLAAGVEIPL